MVTLFDWQQATADALATKITPTGQLKSQMASLSASNMFKNLEKKIPLATKYAGLVGRSKLGMDKIFNKNSSYRICLVLNGSTNILNFVPSSKYSNFSLPVVS